jgi:type I restriction enzyme S subunit
MERYDSHKDSGVEWIGEIPRHWGMSPLKRVVKIGNGRDYKHLEVEVGGFPVFGTGGEFARCSDYLHIGPSVLLGRKGTIDNPLFVTEPFWTSDTIYYTVIREDKIRPKLLFHLVRLIPFSLFSYGSAIPSMTKTDYLEMKFPLPPLHEQERIVEYLDRKTALIDSLIEKTVRKIELLREKRTALINHVVTKGLNPDVEMKDSGVEWIGEIPGHWEFLPIKYVIESGKGSIRTGPFGSTLKSDEFVDDGVRVYNQRSVYDEDFSKSNLFVSNEKYQELKSFEVLPKDVLITSRGTIGKMTVVPEDGEKGVLHPCLIRLRLNRDVLFDRFLWHYVNQSSLFLLSVLTESDSTTIEVIYSDTLSNVRLPIPVISEQEQIVEYLDEQTSIIDSTITTEEKRIELLKEYRQSLISEVVTGKVKVTRDE